MKTLILSILVFSAAGCATLGAAPGSGEITTVPAMESTTDTAPALDDSTPQDIGPKIIIPVTGGVPIIGIPLGGDLSSSMRAPR